MKSYCIPPTFIPNRLSTRIKKVQCSAFGQSTSPLPGTEEYPCSGSGWSNCQRFRDKAQWSTNTILPLDDISRRCNTWCRVCCQLDVSGWPVIIGYNLLGLRVSLPKDPRRVHKQWDKLDGFLSSSPKGSSHVEALVRRGICSWLDREGSLTWVRLKCIAWFFGIECSWLCVLLQRESRVNSFKDTYPISAIEPRQPWLIKEKSKSGELAYLSPLPTTPFYKEQADPFRRNRIAFTLN